MQKANENPPSVAQPPPALAERDEVLPVGDEPLDGELGLPLELLVLDLGVEIGLAHESLDADDVPDDVVGKAVEDRVVIAAAEALEIAVDDLPALRGVGTHWTGNMPQGEHAGR